jgi:molybdopterin-binding protein
VRHYAVQVTTFRLGEAADLLGVSSDTVRRWIDNGRLAAVRDENGHRTVDGAVLAEFARSLGDTEEQERAGAVSSARNRFRGIVTRVVRDTVMAQVEMQAGPYRVVSLMSREAADELGLEPGMVTVAVVKSTNVVVERADGALPRVNSRVE